MSKSFRRKADAEKWLVLEEGDMLAGRWHDPESGTELFSVYCEKWMEERSPTVARKTDYNTEAAQFCQSVTVESHGDLRRRKRRWWATEVAGAYGIPMSSSTCPNPPVRSLAL
jgi:hypothetical protein